MKIDRLKQYFASKFLDRNSNIELRLQAPLQLHDLVLMDASFYDKPEELLESTEITNPKLANSIFYPKFYDSNPKTIKLLELLIAKNKPRVVVETGIANGVSTRAILNAFSQNHLFSSRLISFDTDPRVAVEEFLSNSQFTFKLVSSENNFESQMELLPEVDLFYHDSDHSYSNQMLEYKVAWAKISKGGVLMSDDINWSNAFLDFCLTNNRKPQVLADTEKFSGIVQK